jgi:hypothetical protein
MKHSAMMSGALSVLLCACGAEETATPDPPAVRVGTATLSWNVPTQNTDSSTLADLAGYRVYHGTSADSLAPVATIKSPKVTSFAISNLFSGTHYFAVSALTTSGVESALSAIGSKTFP